MIFMIGSGKRIPSSLVLRFYSIQANIHHSLKNTNFLRLIFCNPSLLLQANDYFEHVVKLYVIPNLWCLMFGDGVIKVGANNCFFVRQQLHQGLAFTLLNVNHQ